ncbi:MAG: glycosyltransferase [Sedimentisphaerales bacterium]|nr:glycosyltransferase [Sedimentisphaerales bacterium]
MSKLLSKGNWHFSGYKENMVEQELKNIEAGRQKNPGYYEEVDRAVKFVVPPQMRVLEIGCSTGRLLADTKPAYGLGIDNNEKLIEAAKHIHADKENLTFVCDDAENFDFADTEPFDYIILSDILPLVGDVQNLLINIRRLCKPSTRLVITYYSNVWRPMLAIASLIGRRQKSLRYNWLSSKDIINLLHLADYDTITKTGRTLLPLKIPVLGWFMNRFLAKMPFFNHCCLTWRIVARPMPAKTEGPAPTVSVVIPTRDERGNIEMAFKRTPKLGNWTELIFVDGHSTDGTVEEIERCKAEYGNQWHRVEILHQTGKGKADAMRLGFDACQGDILMILDSDLTMPPEELGKYYEAIVEGKGDFINGCRLIYPIEKQAMRFLNLIANHLFATLFSWLLDQPVKDTLCGTKVLWRKDYDKIVANRAYFGDFDPFGDFDLLFGATKLNHKIVDMPIHYRNRSYGDIKIHRWEHGLLLFQMSWKAFVKLKLS